MIRQKYPPTESFTAEFLEACIEALAGAYVFSRFTKPGPEPIDGKLQWVTASESEFSTEFQANRAAGKTLVVTISHEWIQE